MKRVAAYMATMMLVTLLVSCEKEIPMTLPPGSQVYVVEASVSSKFPTLNYVFISKSVDYFTPDLTAGGVKGATVTITEGSISGTDTFYNGTSYVMSDISTLPGFDTLFKGLSGIYFNFNLLGKESTPYLLDITLADGSKITGKTFIPQVVKLDTIKYEVKNQDENRDGYKDAFVTLYYADPPTQNNYRMAVYNFTDSTMLGWGSATFYRTFDDEVLNGEPRVYPFARSFQQGDTLNFYFNSIGRKEFLFWQSFGTAANNGGPFATPAQVKSNITGATGSFTGYGCSFRQIILH